jgi:hypothetical protein
LELPKELGDVQQALGKEKEASYVVTVINKDTKKRRKLANNRSVQSIRNLFLMILAMMKISCIKLIDYQNKEKIVINITDDDHEWVERTGKTAYEICNDPARNRIKLMNNILASPWNLMMLQYWNVMVGLSNNI